MSVALALYHFFLPLQFDWAKFVGEVPGQIRWALFAINFFFSVLLLVVGLCVVATAWNSFRNEPLALLVVGGAASFWLANFVYLMRFPFPVPASLSAVQLGLEAFSATSFLLHGVPFGWLVAEGARLRRVPTD